MGVPDRWSFSSLFTLVFLYVCISYCFALHFILFVYFGFLLISIINDKWRRDTRKTLKLLSGLLTSFSELQKSAYNWIMSLSAKMPVILNWETRQYPWSTCPSVFLDKWLASSLTLVQSQTASRKFSNLVLFLLNHSRTVAMKCFDFHSSVVIWCLPRVSFLLRRSPVKCDQRWMPWSSRMQTSQKT